MLSHILVPLDGSALAERVLPHAAALATSTGAQVTLVHVLERPDMAAEAAPVDPLNWHLRKAEAQAYLDRLCARWQETGPRPTAVLLEGQAPERILDFAGQNEVDLIALSSHGQSGLSLWNVSSVVSKIVARAGASILLVRAYEGPGEQLSEVRYRRILVPLDGSQRAEYVLPFLDPLARDSQVQFLLAHVVVRPEVPRRAPLTPEEKELVEQLVARNRQEATRYLARLEAQRPGHIQTRVIDSDNVISALSRLVTNEGIDLVLMCAHGYSCGDGGQRPYGSVVTNFIAYGRAPLLIIQDLPPQEILAAHAEAAAYQAGNGVRALTYDKPAI
ncbi:MAG: universal stress protein [Chloroflexi bacterium]|nr:universal stress protein [Chloroflexota bacterium]MCI0578372.1 universal stress protein [Chloroflexota bacterium]MCI0645388.1 universal stress protein [Chloroflexota bacterium]MCI0732155.1 universal stress protein [Chloroflexota bacterium]